MLRDIPVFVLAAVPALLWFVFALPVFYRLTGITAPINPFRRKHLSLSANDRILFNGLLGFGTSLAIFHLAACYVRWRLYMNPHDRPTWQVGIDAIGTAVLAGITFGLLDGLLDARSRLKAKGPK